MDKASIIKKTNSKDLLLLSKHRILATLLGPTYHANYTLHVLLVCKLVYLSLSEGSTKYSLIGYALFGAKFSGVINDMHISDYLASLVLELEKEIGDEESEANYAWVIYGFLKPWNTSSNKLHAPLRKSILSGINTGNIDATARVMCFSATFCILSGYEIRALNKEVKADREFLLRCGQEAWAEYMGFYWQFILNVMTKTENAHVMIGEGYDESVLLERDLSSDHGNMIVVYGLFKSILCYMFGEYESAIKYASKAEEYLDDVAGLIFLAILPFYDSLSRLAIYTEKSKEYQKDILSKVDIQQNRIRIWAEHEPTNFLHKYWLVEAEKARILKQDREASEYYDKAIALAKAHEYINEEALANERAGYFYESLDRPRFAEVYIREAYCLYEQWGAKAKTDHLTEKYPHWFASESDQSAVQSIAQTLDVNTLIQATKTFTETPQGSGLIHNLMEIVMNHSGAQRGVLILQNRGQWIIEAEATSNPFNMILQKYRLMDQSEDLLALGVVQYAIRTQQNVLLDDAYTNPVYRDDGYIKSQQLQSLLCLPIVYQGRTLGVLYLENKSIKGAFTQSRLDVLNLLISQMAVSLSNTLQYEQQLQSVQYLYQLRTQFEVASTTQALVNKTGELLSKQFETDHEMCIEVMVDQHVWHNHVSEDTHLFEYQSDIVWSDRTRGYLKICSNRELDQNIQNLFVTETASQLSRTLESRELQMQLLQSARLVSLGQMAAGVAHELNQPLGALSNVVNDVYLRLRDGITLSDEDLSQMMQESMRVVNRMSDTINHLRVFSRDEAQDPPELYDINEIVVSSLRLIEVQMENQGVDLQLDLTENLSTLLGYGNQMEQVVLNLLSNARDAVLEHKKDKRVMVRSFQDNGDVVLEVEDDGIGISEENISRVFEPFFTTKESGKGTGLGLSISYAIVKNQSGDILCESAVGEGTTFRVCLPVQKASRS